MTTSQNGYSANDRSVIASYTIPGTTEKIAIRKGGVSIVLLDWLGFWNAEIEPLQQKELDEWGYAERNIRGSDQVSNHASGTAADANAQKHPLGATRTLTDAQYGRINTRLKLYRGVLRSGIYYSGRKDEMHAEINKPPPEVEEVADLIRRGALGGGHKSYLVGRAPFSTTTGKQPSHTVQKNPYRAPATKNCLYKQNDHQAAPIVAVKFIQWACGLLRQDGYFGPGTTAAVKSFQRAHHLTPDGVVGPKTISVMKTITR
jgi:peptidoglycan hydrolase-like protein with peptidoglycan-binding domain